MFYLDGISLSKIKKELKQDLIPERGHRKVSKISLNTAMSLSLFFGNIEFVISIDPHFPICYVSDSREPKSMASNGFVDCMRKQLVASELIDIDQVGYDRVLIFYFSRLNELGEHKIYKLYFEIIGKYSNLVLTDDRDVIIDSLKKTALMDTGKRTIFPGVRYSSPNDVHKVNPESWETSRLSTMEYEGVGNVLARNIENTNNNENHQDHQTLGYYLSSDIKPILYYFCDKIVFATVLDIAPTDKSIQFDQKREFLSYRELINTYVEETKMSVNFDHLRSTITSAITKKIKKDKKILANIAEDIRACEDMENYKNLGDILASVLYNVKKGMKEVTAFDFYTNKDIVISLDEALYPQENLERYYKKYNKLKRTKEANILRKSEIEAEIDYLTSTQYFVDNAGSITELTNIYDELVHERVLSPKQSKAKPQKSRKVEPKDMCGMVEYQGYRLIYGRNNIENDTVTFKMADRSNIWCHAKDIPGSHVVILGSDANVPEDVLMYAADLAATHSKSNIGDKVKIDYTQKKYINKPKGAKPGFVTYTGEKSIIIKREK